MNITPPPALPRAFVLRICWGLADPGTVAICPPQARWRMGLVMNWAALDVEPVQRKADSEA